MPEPKSDQASRRGFDHVAIDAKWQAKWAADQAFATPVEPRPGKKQYVLDMFPYPSGAGLHVGHPRGYIGSDVLARFLRAQGYSVLHPMGWDAFGLPAENYAIKTGIHPAKTTQQAIDRYRSQLQLIGLSYDWSRELNTSNPNYYRWTQWLFVQLFKAGLAYQREAPVNWCPKDQTVLANEQVVNGACEQCGSSVEQKRLTQWFFKTTAYADELLAALDDLDWPEPIKLMQRNWIGKSEGSEIDFAVVDQAEQITIFTTRADTLFGATYLVLAPEHPLVTRIVTDAQRSAVNAYIAAATEKKALERRAVDRPKTGVFTGAFALNPATDKPIPIWVADYVLTSYGTGAIMAVPAHDERDYAFATTNDLPVVQVVAPDVIDETNPPRPNKPNTERSIVHAILLDATGQSFVALRSKTQPWLTMITGGIESGEDPVAAGSREILEETGYTNVRYLGRLPYVIHAKFYAAHKDVNRAIESHILKFQILDDERVPLSDEEAALHTVEWLPRDQLHTLHPMSELRHMIDWIEHGDRPYTSEGVVINSGRFSGLPSSEARASITKAVGGRATTRYKLRDWLVSRQRYWGAPIPIIHCQACGAVPVSDEQLPVQLPTDVDFLPTGESPLARSTSFSTTTCPTCHGPAKRETDTMDTFVDSSWYFLRYTDPHNNTAIVNPAAASWLPVDWYVGGAEHAVLHLLYSRFITKALADQKLITFREPFVRLRNQGLIRADDGRKMSKRWGNVVNPDDVIAAYGADTLRAYELFMGPFSDSMPWSTRSMIGVRRWLDRVWELRKVSLTSLDDRPDLEREIHRTIQKVTDDIRALKFNTAVSALMEFTNAAGRQPGIPATVFQRFLIILAPIAPHLASELWQELEFTGELLEQVWPAVDPSVLTAKTVTVAVQVAGKTRATIQVATQIGEEDLIQMARREPSVQRHLTGEPRRTIVVPSRIVNFIP